MSKPRIGDTLKQQTDHLFNYCPECGAILPSTKAELMPLDQPTPHPQDFAIALIESSAKGFCNHDPERYLRWVEETNFQSWFNSIYDDWCEKQPPPGCAGDG